MNDAGRLVEAVMDRANALALYARQWVDRSAAEDAVQEALIALLMEKRPPDDPVAWMFRAVRNAAIDQARSASRRRQRERIVADARRQWFEPLPAPLLDAAEVEQLVRGLPIDQREIIVLRIWGELGFAQIAKVMQLGLATVHDRYVSALEQMRNTLEKPCRNQTA